jgi:hypothetical protein
MGHGKAEKKGMRERADGGKVKGSIAQSAESIA